MAIHIPGKSTGYECHTNVCGIHIFWKKFYSEQYLPVGNCINVFLCNFVSSYRITFESKHRATAKASEKPYTNVLQRIL